MQREIRDVMPAVFWPASRDLDSTQKHGGMMRCLAGLNGVDGTVEESLPKLIGCVEHAGRNLRRHSK